MVGTLSKSACFLKDKACSTTTHYTEIWNDMTVHLILILVTFAEGQGYRYSFATKIYKGVLRAASALESSQMMGFE